MKASCSQSMVIILLLCRVTCYNRCSKCVLKYVTCPVECPKVQPTDGKSEGCFLDCYSLTREAVCRGHKPDCNGVGSACFDPRFIGGDGIVFYFHGKSDEHFSLVSDINLQINSRFIGLRPAGRTRDYAWIQALGLMFGSHTFTLEATRTEKWDSEEDHLQISSKNSATDTLSEAVELSVNVIPVTEEDNRIHNFQIPSNDSFTQLEVQFRFFSLSAQVEGVLQRLVGRTSTGLVLFCPQTLGLACSLPAANAALEGLLSMQYAALDCTSGVGSGNGIVCRK
ncbi:hypothetical protein PVL29_012801 [Vitis rotundifolia]|uniref:Uncharacterized protein n=1 Tax=Vitis rotundifolia TaxID=103349 RepID=A0AA38ZJY5_VITRO|nr:hypothetical protein PVL29_012801 [Vitis rotundifolia]